MEKSSLCIFQPFSRPVAGLRKHSLGARSLLTLFAVLFTAGLVSAQKIPEAVARQIQSLLDEKAARTPAQKKISSQILYAYKANRGMRISSEVATLRTDVAKDAAGKIKVELDAAVTPRLLDALRSLGAEILFSSEKYGNILANVPLDAVERMAEPDAVKQIRLWSPPMNNDTRSNAENNSVDGTRENSINERRAANDNGNPVADLKTRSEKIRKQLIRAFGTVTDRRKLFYAGSVTSEADVTHKAAIARSVFGIDGTGIKIGVLSNGVDGYTASQASGDLPPVITILPGQAGTGSEGRAMMELIHDLVPGADLYFATANPTQAAFAQNIQNLRSAGCDIIVDDVTYFAEGVFQDGVVAQAVNTVTADGALYFSSAGNSGNKNDGTAGVWEGDFADGGAATAPLPLTGNVHNFSGGTVYNTLTVGGRVTLKWSDPLGASGNDYDLFVTNAAGTTVVASSSSVQDGNDNPYEDVGNCFAGERIYILKKTGAAAKALHLNTNRGVLTFSTPGVVFGHNAAASAYTVAATPASTPFGAAPNPTGPYPGTFNPSNTVERFSSDGPRRMFFNPDGTEITPGNVLFTTNGGTVLQKPDITAADGAVTATPGFNPFFGTSAAAPHAAAIAALLKSKFPAITPAQIRSALTSSAIDIETPGVDRDAGAGIIMAYEALVAAGATTTYAYLNLGAVSTTEGSHSNGNGAIEPGETANMTIQLNNLSPNVGATGVTAVLSSATPGVTVLSPVSFGDIAASGTATNTATPFVIGINASVPCGSNIDFTLTVTYGGGETAQKTFTLPVVTLGTAPATITATLGSAPATGTGFTSTSGTQEGRLNRNGIVPSCGSSKTTPALQTSTGSRAYHAYTFTNNTPSSQCVTVSIASSGLGSIYEVVYGNGGFVPTSLQTNYLADQGTTTNTSPFSFTAPAGQQFTVVVHDINVVSGGSGISYNLNVGLVNQCSSAPACTAVVLSPTVLPSANKNTAYTQSISATGGSGYYLYSLSGALPAGLAFSGNTLSGTPTQAGSFPITVTATDITGCPAGSQNYILVVNEFVPPAITQCQTNIEATPNQTGCTSSQTFGVTATGVPTPTVTYKIHGTNTVITSPYAFPVGITTVDVTASNGVPPDATCSFTVTISSSTLTATLPDASAYSTGVNANTIYVGWAPASKITYAATGVTGGQPPYTYLWTAPGLAIVGANNASSVQLTGTTAGSYTLTLSLKDAYGCEKVLTKTVNVMDIRCGNTLDKVTVCQTQPQKNSVTLCISGDAVATQLAKGCYLGVCRPSTSVTRMSPNATEPTVEALSLKALPNPTSGHFTVEVTSPNTEKATLQVFDLFGRLLEQRTVQPGSTTKIGATYQPGSYLVRVTQGSEHRELKLLKMAE